MLGFAEQPVSAGSGQYAKQPKAMVQLPNGRLGRAPINEAGRNELQGECRTYFTQKGQSARPYIASISLGGVSMWWSIARRWGIAAVQLSPSLPILIC